MEVMRRLAGKVVIVAGGGDIGSACARRYAAEGAAVVFGDLRPELVEGVVAEIAAAGGRAAAIRLDGADEASIAAAVALALDRFGGIDGLHANFACVVEGMSGTDVTDVPLDHYDETMRVNARGFMLCTRLVLPHIIARGGGSIVYTSAGAATQGVATRFAYAMSKQAGHALMRHVATRFGADGVRANALAPGVILKEGMPAEVRAIAAARAPIARPGRPLDIAAVGALLLSDEGSYITGQIIGVDGGITMRP